MANRKLKTLLLDVYENEVREIEIEDDLHAFYEVLHCDCISAPTYRIGDRTYDIMADEEGLYKPIIKISAIDDDLAPMIVGSIMFFNFNSHTGEWLSLTDDDIAYIKSHIKTVSTRLFPDGYPMLTGCTYVV